MIYNLNVFLTEEYRSIISKVIFKDKYTLYFIGEPNEFLNQFREYSEKGLYLYYKDCKGLIPSSRVEENADVIVKYIEEGANYREVTNMIINNIATDIVEDYIFDKYKGTKVFDEWNKNAIELRYN